MLGPAGSGGGRRIDAVLRASAWVGSTQGVPWEAGAAAPGRAGKASEGRRCRRTAPPGDVPESCGSSGWWRPARAPGPGQAVRAAPAVQATPLPASFQGLDVAEECTADPTVTRAWLVENNNDFDVPFTWTLVEDPTQTATPTVPANGSLGVTTTTVPGTDTLRVVQYGQGEAQAEQGHPGPPSGVAKAPQRPHPDRADRGADAQGPVQQAHPGAPRPQAQGGQLRRAGGDRAGLRDPGRQPLHEHHNRGRLDRLLRRAHRRRRW